MEEQLKTGQVSGPAHYGRLALQMLTRTLGEGLDTTPFEDINMIHIFALIVLDGLSEEDSLYGRILPTGLQPAPPHGPVGLAEA